MEKAVSLAALAEAKGWSASPRSSPGGIDYTIPRRCDETRTGPFNRALYKERNRTERLVNRLKQFRRVATRYEKRAMNFLAMVTIASILLWL